MQETMTTLRKAVRVLAERWSHEGCKAFDEGRSPVTVAEAARQLRCAQELLQLLDTLERDWREHGAFPSERRGTPRDRRKKSRTDRRQRP
jgi:hypothetical protein